MPNAGEGNSSLGIIDLLRYTPGETWHYPSVNPKSWEPDHVVLSTSKATHPWLHRCHPWLHRTFFSMASSMTAAWLHRTFSSMASSMAASRLHPTFLSMHSFTAAARLHRALHSMASSIAASCFLRTFCPWLHRTDSFVGSSTPMHLGSIGRSTQWFHTSLKSARRTSGQWIMSPAERIMLLGYIRGPTTWCQGTVKMSEGCRFPLLK